MKGITWSRDSHGLFDYESRHLTKNTMKTHNPSQIQRKNNELELVQIPSSKIDLSLDDQEIKPLLNIINENGTYSLNNSCLADQFYIESVIGTNPGAGSSSPTSKKEETLMDKDMANMSKTLNEHMYLVVRSLKHNNNKIEYQLQKGDIIKLGRIKFAVKEIAIVEQTLMEVDEG